RGGGRNDNYGSVRAAHPGSRRGGQLQTAGSQPIVTAAACPTSLLPGAPVPEPPTTLTRAPDTTTPCRDLHASTTARGRTPHSSFSTAAEHARTATTRRQDLPPRPTRRAHPRVLPKCRMRCGTKNGALHVADCHVRGRAGAALRQQWPTRACHASCRRACPRSRV